MIDPELHYETLLANAPDHYSPEFLTYLRENNTVVEETYLWLIIENFKYHTPQKPHYTAFCKGRWGDIDFGVLQQLYPDFDFLVKAPKRRSVKRFHIHLISKE